jgi:hypothetical protein
MVRVALALLVPRAAPIVADAFDVTFTVLTVNFPVVCLPPTDTVAGTVASLVEEESLTVTAFDPTGAFRVTTPAEVFPPTTDVGESDRLTTCIGLTVKVACFETPPAEAVIVTVCAELTR